MERDLSFSRVYTGLILIPLFMPVIYAVPESLLEKLNLGVNIFSQNN